MMHKKKIVILVYLISGLAFLLTACDDSKIKGTPVQAMIAKQQIYPLTAKTNGTIVADKAAHISSEVSGTVENILFQDGQFVKKGQVLFQLDNQKDQANLASVQAQLTLKESTLKKERELYKKHFISQVGWENIESQVKQLAAQTNSVQSDLNKTSIVSPFDGIVGEREVNLGDYIHPGDVMVSIVDESSLKVKYNFPDILSSEINSGQSVVVTVPSLNNISYQGIVDYVSLEVDPDSRMLSLEAKFNGDLKFLRPGFYVEITQILDPNRQVILLPEEAVQIDENGKYVYKIVNGKAVYTVINTSIEENGMVIVYSGVSAGDKVIISGLQNISNNDPVKIIKLN